MATKQEIPDLSHLPLKGGRFSASAYAKKHNYKAYTHKGITYWKTYEGKFTAGVTLEDALEKRRASQRRGGSREASQRRKEIASQVRDSKYTKLSKEQIQEAARKTQEFNKKGLDADHSFSKETFSKGDILNPENLVPLEPEINRSLDYRKKAIDRSAYHLERELKNPSLSMSTDELIDLIEDVNPKGEVGRAYLDTIARHIGQPQFDPEGMMRDFDLEFRTQERARLHLRDEINNRLNSVFTNDPSDELYSMGLWHDGKTLDDSWVKITRELNTDSGTLVNGKWTPAPDPTARTNIDILSDIGQGEGKFSDIVDLKNKFHHLKRTLPPGEYYMHADNPIKAKYYQRAFRNDPWVGPSGEQGGMRMKDGSFQKYDTLKLTVPDEATQFQQAAEGPYPRWQDQGVPQSNKTASDIARRNEAQMLADRPVLSAAAEASGGLKNALRKAGSLLPVLGAGMDAWDVQQRYEEMMNNPNEGFTDWLDKAQFSIASATLGTSFWAEPANFALGMTNLGIDAMRTIFEEEKRDDFGDMLQGIGRGIGHVGRLF